MPEGLAWCMGGTITEPMTNGQMSKRMNRTREPLEAVQAGLPASWYRDPAHYERELEAFWYGKWIGCAREEELPAPGDWKRRPHRDAELWLS